MFGSTTPYDRPFIPRCLCNCRGEASQPSKLHENRVQRAAACRQPRFVRGLCEGTAIILHSQGSMGDFWSPKRRDVVERLRRRIEVYRQNHDGCIARYEPSINARYEQCRQETQLLQRRLLDSREKKSTKQQKTNKESNPLSEQRNLVLTVSIGR